MSGIPNLTEDGNTAFEVAVESVASAIGTGRKVVLIAAFPAFTLPSGRTGSGYVVAGGFNHSIDRLLGLKVRVDVVATEQSTEDLDALFPPDVIIWGKEGKRRLGETILPSAFGSVADVANVFGKDPSPLFVVLATSREEPIVHLVRETHGIVIGVDDTDQDSDVFGPDALVLPGPQEAVSALAQLVNRVSLRFGVGADDGWSIRTPSASDEA